MGFLATGKPLSWSESLPFISAIKRRGIRQFIQLYNEYKDFRTPLKWGDEVGEISTRVSVTVETPSTCEAHT